MNRVPRELGLDPIFADLVIAEDRCNLSCAYCLTATATRMDATPGGRRLDLSPRGDWGGRVLRTIARLARQDVTTLKISGGELLMHAGAVDVVMAAAALFERVVVLTNGVFLTTAVRARLRRIPNLVLQVSLDSVVPEGNAYRIPSAKAHAKVLARIDDAFAAGIRGEVYAVVSDRSAPHLAATVRHFAAAEGVRVLPFPVRGIGRQGFAAKDVGGIREVLAMAPDYAGTLPHPAYLEELVAFHGTGGRRLRCGLPRVAFSVFDDGTVGDCPNIWFERHDPGTGTVAEVVGRSRLRPLLLADRPRLEACRACMTPWDILNLYLDGRVPLAAVAALPSLSGRRTLARLAAVGAVEEASLA